MTKIRICGLITKIIRRKTHDSEIANTHDQNRKYQPFIDQFAQHSNTILKMLELVDNQLQQRQSHQTPPPPKVVDW